MLYRLLADLVVVVHFGYVAFVLFGQLAILAGIAFRWAWIRNPTFRVVHLAAIGIVVLEVWCGMTCPLTTWERALREGAGDVTYEGDFIADCVHNVLFYQAPPWVFGICYSAFGALVLLTFFLAPPRFRPKVGDSSPPAMDRR